MPTRVLALCGDHTKPSVRLVECRGQRGRYIALSHCWGSNGKQPLRTTSESFRAHHDGISFENLPKTFQDCVELSQGMGVKYVWIDSLCIIQDDHRDWLHEAARMGDVYRNAALVVAASGAKDSSEGLFITDRRRATVVRLPYHINGVINGTFNMAQQTFGYRYPNLGPLEGRAWTLQERYLARRFVSFMPDVVTWVCQTHSIREAKEFCDIYQREGSWYEILREYTARKLTFPSDRTEALRGVAEEFKGLRKGRYVYKYGVWEADLTSQLLWFNLNAHSNYARLSDGPSWSWTATESAKRWPKDYSFGLRRRPFPAEEMPEQIMITPAGHLRSCGHLSTTQPAPSYLYDQFTRQKLGLDELDELHAVEDFAGIDLWDFFLLIKNIDNVYSRTVLGFVRFDNIEARLYTHVWFLAKQKCITGKDIRHAPVQEDSQISPRRQSFVGEQTVVSSHRIIMAH
jgi:hypothetical protein